MMKKHDSCYFLRWQWQLRTRRPIHIGGTTAPCYFVGGSESSRVRMVLGAKSP